MRLTTTSYQRGTGWSTPLPDHDGEQTLVLAFGDPAYADDPAALQDLQRRYPRSHVLGCSTAGEIFGTAVHEGTLSVAIAAFDRTRLRTAFAHVGAASESLNAGRDIGEQLLAEDLRAVFVLSDGLQVNGSQLVRGINEILPASVVVTGGLAGDGARFAKTWNLLHGVPHPNVVAAVGLYGDAVRVGHGSKGGWDLFGPERRVTRSRGNVLFELDGKPALQLYKHYLGERADGLPATGLLFPLSLRTDQHHEKRLVRTILAVDESAQSMTFAGDVPEGSLVQLMRANMDRLIEGAGDAALVTAAAAPPTSELLSIAISCVGRRLVLGERTEEEVEAVLDVLPATTRQIGFYSYGEISPYATGACDLHNQTMTLTTIAER